jgi:N-glycosylase/DNA lyase
MTWPQAKIEALRLVEEIAARHGEPRQVQLVLHPSEASYRRHKPNEGWTWSFHTQVVRSTYRELLKRGYNVRLVNYE